MRIFFRLLGFLKAYRFRVALSVLLGVATVAGNVGLLSTAAYVISAAALVSYISAAFTLLPGDVILTGTPAGVGPLAAGERVEVEIEGIGTLGNPVVTRD